MSTLKAAEETLIARLIKVESQGVQQEVLQDHLERGDILLFQETPFALSDQEREFLTRVRQRGSRFYKNIAYHPEGRRLSGFAGPADYQARLSEILRRYSENLIVFVAALLPEYGSSWRVDLASFRPIEECGRRLPWRARNDLIHIDAFPTRPTNGARILRVFTNINSYEPRIWTTTERFEVLANRFGFAAGLRAIAQRPSIVRRSARRFLRRVFDSMGIPLAEPAPYDRFMLSLHDWLKADRGFQVNCPKKTLQFPPGSTWIAFTDLVPHAVLSGQFAMEQTFMVPCAALRYPERAPVRLLERLCGRSLTA